MAIHVALNHQTRYQYDRPVNLGPQIVRLRPAPHCRTRILSYSLRVTPKKHFINWQQDPQSNFLARLVFAEPTREFKIEVDLVAEMAVYNPFDFFLEPGVEHFPFAYAPDLDHELEPFRRCSEATPLFQHYVDSVRRELPNQAPSDAAISGDRPANPRTMDFLVELNRKVWRDVRYIIRLEPGVQPPEETLQKGTGSCRDSAWLLCQLMRGLGLSARFVSGYLVQLTPDVKSLDGPSGAERDFTDLHAWCEVYLPGAGWIGLDPTSGLLAGEGHIPLAATPDPQSAAPVSGLVEECETQFSFEMKVSRIHESPRVTKPYTDEQWQAIEALGHQIDAELRQGDCRLTMGGEPTFVSIDDRNGAEWNTVALGGNKRELADQLIRRLKRQFSSGALLHYGQGKWYPGESLPRWAFGCYWRKDGEPIWANEKLLADEKTAYGFGEKRAEEFIYSLATRLGCAGQWIMPAFEDTWYYLWRERRLPTNVDPFTSNLENEEDRVRLAKIFEQGLEKVIGFVLPLQPKQRSERAEWFSGPWFLRPERCYLLPGDSPLGFRLPLDSLPQVTESDYPHVHEQDPFEQRHPLPPRTERALQKHLPAGWMTATGPSDTRRNRGSSLTQTVQAQGMPQLESASELFRAPARGESASLDCADRAMCRAPSGSSIRVYAPCCPARGLPQSDRSSGRHGGIAGHPCRYRRLPSAL